MNSETIRLNNNDIFIHTSFETIRLYDAYQRDIPWSVKAISPKPIFDDYYKCTNVPAPSVLLVMAFSMIFLGRRKRVS
jgi:hypothetical protein